MQEEKYSHKGIDEKEEAPEEFKLYKKRMSKYFFQMLVLVFFAVGIFWAGFNRGKESQQALNPVSIEKAVFDNKDENVDSSIDFSLFWNVWELLKEKFVDTDKLDARKLYYGAIKGMMEATGDPYTTFFDPEENKKFGEDISGNFEGIGAELGIKSGILTVIAPLQGTPAEKAGLRSGDKIIKIDGKTAAEMSIEEAVDNIRGQKGSSVALTIFREGQQDTQDITVKRDVINVKSVTFELKEKNIALIKVTRFGDDTTKGFTDAINSALQQKASGVVIDLRNNPGGYLESAIDVASKLLVKNKIVVIEENGDKSQKKMYSRGGDLASSLETVVLINEGSASASEILAGALKDNRPDNVTLVGKKSFGKGSVQEFVKMSQGTAAKITVARWLTPNGTQINEQGIKPDKEVELSNEDYNNNKDPQMEAALQILKDKLVK
ncbi:MAG: Carboxyl-terminal protease [Candidatus Moranbacteria bacterium GW2011_GWE1_36_7]|nr:MAG: Carboxyl-terminal protease [Candidatus Moranbacteria bacterium GW2011_GWD2_36_12]KKQ04685.1 MAG: Carboxyl-terminal protease [Candidatus Moranbacteria bacterium GW2011_GWE2_36_40]KKQ11948.1 MAG: Carboxyl-terminal protease [Candidatus Moranbacteria bacterium GW2011_GWE1_36_7]